MKEVWVTQRKGQAIEHVLLPCAEYEAICAIVDAAQAMHNWYGLPLIYRRGHQALCAALDVYNALNKEQ